MNIARYSTALPILTCLLAVHSLASPAMAQTPATKGGHTFAPASPGQKVIYRPAGENVIEVAARPGAPTLADKAMANRNARPASGTVRQASTTRTMQDPAEEVATPPGKTQGEKSVVVPSTSGVTMEEIPAGHQVVNSPYIDGSSGAVIGDHYNQPFFTPESSGVVMDGGVVMNDGSQAQGCADCGCYGGARDGLRVLRPCADGCLIPCPRISVDNTQLFAGAQGFTGVANRGETGSFGFHEGVNLGGPFPFLPVLDLSMQVGVMGAQSNHNGASFTPNSRDQLFVTAGLFHRVDWGFQGGVVFDYMHDEWYYNLDINQVRGEISWINPENHEIGFWFATSDSTQVVDSTIVVNTRTVTFSENWDATDLYAFFYRKRFCETNGVIRGYGGFTENGDGIIGGNAMAPLSDSLSVSGSFAYLIPNSEDPQGVAPHERESWNVQVSLVWFPGKGARQWTYHRPLFDVANNGSMFLQHQ